MADFAPAAVASTPSSSALRQFSRLSDWLAPLAGSVTSTATSTTSDNGHVVPQMSDDDRTGLDPRSPLFRKLIAGILFSRQLALTYYAVFAGVVLVYAVVNWGPRLRTWLKRRNSKPGAQSHRMARGGNQHGGLKERLGQPHGLNTGDAAGSAISSASSSPRRHSERADEQTPLLANNGGPDDKRHFAARWWHIASSWFTYQPGSLRGFRNRQMPSNATTLFMLLFLGINLFYLFFNLEFTVPMIFIIADRAGLLFATSLPILYTLSAKNQPLQPLIGYSYASLNIVHRRLGEWMCVLAAIHATLMFVVWATLLRPGGYTFVRFITDRVVILGIGGLICYEALYFTSLATIRQKAYETFLAAHIVLQVGALGFLYFHHPKSRPYVAASVAIWAVDRFVYRVGVKTKTYKAALTVLHDGETISVNVSVPLRKPSWIWRATGMKSVQHGWQTLDHVFLSVPAISQKHWLQAHPFSIASAAPAPDAQSAELELIIRARDGFSRDLLVCAAEHATMNVRIDGPYGSHSADRMLQESEARVVIAGGSGIAVTYPLLEKLLAAEDARFDDAEYATHTTSVRPILFIWVVHNMQQWTWIDMERLRSLAGRSGVDLVLTEPTDGAGRPDLGGIVGKWIKAQDCQQFGVVVSGPDGMSREVRNECAGMQARGLNVNVEVEKYGW